VLEALSLTPMTPKKKERKRIRKEGRKERRKEVEVTIRISYKEKLRTGWIHC
jgi:hypothetical protein